MKIAAVDLDNIWNGLHEFGVKNGPEKTEAKYLRMHIKTFMELEKQNPISYYGLIPVHNPYSIEHAEQKTIFGCIVTIDNKIYPGMAEVNG